MTTTTNQGHSKQSGSAQIPFQEERMIEIL